MTNEELDRARVDEAIRNGNGIVGSVALIAARLAREGWTPPVAVDPEVGSIWKHYNGNVYEVIAIANTLDTEKYPKAVIHKNTANGTVWTRRADDWHRSYTLQSGMAFAEVKENCPQEEVLDPDIAEAKRIAENWDEIDELVYAGIKRGRALAAAEAKPGMVWVKHGGSYESPVNKNWFVAIFRRGEVDAGRARLVDWRVITHYAVITCPFEGVA